MNYDFQDPADSIIVWKCGKITSDFSNDPKKLALSDRARKYYVTNFAVRVIYVTVRTS